MASTSKAFKKCVDSCPRYLTPDDTHTLWVFCLGEEHARDVLEGKICMHCELFLWKSSAPVCPSFEEGGAAVCFPWFGTHRCRGTEANEIVGFAVGYGRWIRDGPPPFRACRPRTRVSCWIVTMRSFWHHQIQRLVLCWVMPRKSRRCLRVRKLRLNPLNPPALHMSYWRLWIIK